MFGLLVMPALIYLPGYYVLKPYENGGLFALYFDYFKGLVEPRPSCWIVLVGTVRLPEPVSGSSASSFASYK